MTAPSPVKRTLFFFYLFLVLPKAYADPFSKKSTYSFTSGNSQHDVEFTEQRNEKSFKYIASTLTTGTVNNRGESNSVEGVFTITTEESNPKSPYICIQSSTPLPESTTPSSGSSDDLMSWPLRHAPVLNRELIDELWNPDSTDRNGYSRLTPRAPAYYTLSLGAFRVNDLIVNPLLTNLVVASRSGNLVQIRAEISVASVASSGTSFTHVRSTAGVLIDISLTGQDSVRVETIRTTGSESDSSGFNLSFLSEGQAEPLQPAPQEPLQQRVPQLDPIFNPLGRAVDFHESS